MTDWAETLRLAEKELERVKEVKVKEVKVVASKGKRIGKIQGTSSGQIVPRNKEQMQRRKMKHHYMNRGNFLSTNDDFDKPTPEQIALRAKREERERKEAERKKARRHRGGYKKTKAYRKKMAKKQ